MENLSLKKHHTVPLAVAAPGQGTKAAPGTGEGSVPDNILWCFSLSECVVLLMMNILLENGVGKVVIYHYLVKCSSSYF